MNIRKSYHKIKYEESLFEHRINNWEAKRFGYLFNFYSGGTPSTNVSAYWDGDLPWVSAKDMKVMVITNTEDHISEDAVKDSATCKLPKGSMLLVNRSGILKHSLPVAVISREMSINQDIRGCVPRARVNVKYMAYLISGNQRALLAIWRQQGATVESLSFESVKTSLVFLPSIDEQQAIANFLDTRTARLDALLEKKRALVDRLKEQRSALISHAVTRSLDPDVKLKASGIEWLGDIPEHWEIRPLSQITSQIQTGPFGTQLHASDYIEDGIPLINPAHLISGRVMPSSSCSVDDGTASRLSRYKLQRGDIVMARRGEIGRCAVVSEVESGWLCGTGSLLIRLLSFDSTYVGYVISNAGFSELLELHAVGTTMLNLNPTILGRMFFPVPPLSEQTVIADHIDRETDKIDRMLKKVEAAIDKLVEYRSALISAAVTGKIDVRKLEA